MSDSDLTTDAQTTKTTELQWRDRAWSEVEFDFLWEDNGDLDKAVRRNGWSCFETLGHMDGLSVNLYSRDATSEAPRNAASEAPRYFACYNTPDDWNIIVIPRLQDLIDFCAHVSTTMLAALLPEDASMLLDELCEKSSWRASERKRAREDDTRDKASRAKIGTASP